VTEPLKGRRRPDREWGDHDLPDDLQPGDYWKCVGLDLDDNYPSNLTRTVWMFMSPDGHGVGTLMQHTVRENEDGTITIAPGDGSSNSVLHKSGHGHTWHGYVDHGVWKSV
jgi:hypothetical protein